MNKLFNKIKNKVLKSIFLTLPLGGVGGGFLLTSCDDYLDTLPDDRAEVNTIDKVGSLLVSAYSTKSADFILEMTSDNVTDNGTSYVCQPNQDKLYRFEQVETTGNDDPKAVWQGEYLAMATANEALADIEALGVSNAQAQAYRAEALICRAYAAFNLANTFCMAYDPTKATEYLGVPYPTKSGEDVTERGTLAETYQNINADIEAALPYINESYMDTPKYRFNKKAAYAFAARFNLFYHKYDKAIEYANKVLGENPQTMLRDMSALSGLGVDDYSNAYISTSVNANLMLKTAYSLAGRTAWASSYMRYESTYTLNTYELYWAHMPWSSSTGSSGNCLYEAHRLFGNEYFVYNPKMMEYFETIDKVNLTGYAHIVDAVFTADETCLVRAEAYALKGEFQKSLDDINLWMSAHCATKYDTYKLPTMTETNVNSFFNALSEVPAEITSDSERGVKKPLHPQGFTVDSGTMTNLIYMILQMRRIETWHQGQRMQDIKRYGIEYSHVLQGEKTLVFKAGDLRGAIQLPIDVLDTGMTENPR